MRRYMSEHASLSNYQIAKLSNCINGNACNHGDVFPDAVANNDRYEPCLSGSNVFRRNRRK
jgi:hypothetical protein